jgi:TonB family protein
VTYKITLTKCNNEQQAKFFIDLLSAIATVDKEEAKNILLNRALVVSSTSSGQQIEAICTTIRNMGAQISFEPEKQIVIENKPLISPISEEEVLPPMDMEEPEEQANLKPVSILSKSEDEEDPDYPSNINNLIKIADQRKDIFIVQSERSLLGTVLIALIAGLGAGFGFNNMDIINTSPDFFEKLPPERIAKLVIDIPKMDEKKEKAEKQKKRNEEKTLEDRKDRPKSGGGGGSAGGKGDPRIKVTQKGVLGIISGKVKGKSVFGRDVLAGEGSFVKDIDAILENIGGLKQGGHGGVGRRGLAGVGYGQGYGGGGFGDGSGGIDGLLGGILGGGSDVVSLKKKGTLKVEAPKTISAGPMSGGRSQESIMRVVMQHIAGLRYSYNKRLKEKPSMKGKVTVRFSIDAEGNVVDAKVINSSMNDSQLEEEIASQILRWRFDPVDKPGLAVVEYPFAFSQ